MAQSNADLKEKLNNTPAPTANGKALSVADQVQGYLSTPKMREQLAKALPKHLTPDRLTRVAVTTIRTTPDLMKCSIESLLAAIIQSAQLGLEPGLLGHAYFVPFNRKIREEGKPDRWIKEVQFIIGYKGLLDLARRTGGIVTIAAHPIFSKDEFKVRHGYDQELTHIPNFQDRGEVIGFYAYAVTKDGGRYCEVMTLKEVEGIRARSKAKDSGPWVTDFVEMGRKTVLRRLCKYLPLSVEIASNIQDDGDREFGDATAIEVNLGEAKGVASSAPAASSEGPEDSYLDGDEAWGADPGEVKTIEGTATQESLAGVKQSETVRA